MANWTLGFIGTLLLSEGAELLRLTLDPYAVPFTGAVSLATGLLFGIFPAFHGTRAALVSALKDDAGQPAGARSAAGFRRGLVTAQFALATMLLVAGLFIQSLRNVSGVDLGIQTKDVVTFRLWPGLNGYEDERTNALYTRVETELAAQPGVTAATAASIPVFVGDSWGTDVMVEGFDAGPDTNRSTRFNQVGTDYFRTLDIPLLAGRTFTEADGREALPVAIVNEAFARKFDLGRNAVGRRLGRGGLDVELDTEIVGLVADTRYSHVKWPAPPLLYVPYRQEDGVGALAFYARSSLPPEGMLRTIPALVAGVDPKHAGHASDDAPPAGGGERVRGSHHHHAVGRLRRARDAVGGGGSLRRAGLHGGPAHARARSADGTRRGRGPPAGDGATSGRAHDACRWCGRACRRVRSRPPCAVLAL